MKAINNDCQVLYLGNHHETYRGINHALGTMGLSVMWVQDVDSAKMLAQTTDMTLMLCDPELQASNQSLFEPGVIPPGASCVALPLPEPDPSGSRFERNVRRTARLLKVVKSLPALSP